MGPLNTAADAASGLAGDAAAEVTDNPTIQMIASLLGGGGTVAAAHSGRPRPQAPSMEDLRATQRDAYGQVEASAAQLTPLATQTLQGRVAQRMANEHLDPYLQPKASRTVERMGEMDQPSIYEVEQRRRLAGRDVAGSLNPSERALGQGMKDEIDAFLSNLSPARVQGGAVDEVVEALQTGRAATQKIKKAEAIDQAVYKAENRAATGGTGGNAINTTRQNIRAILDDAKKRRGYSATEIEAMEGIVRVTPTINAARLLGRLSPTSGALPMIAGGGMVGAAGATLNPLLAAPPMIGLVARGVGERMTQKQVNNLSATIRNGAPLPTKMLSDAEKAVVSALLAVQATKCGSDPNQRERHADDPTK